MHFVPLDYERLMGIAWRHFLITMAVKKIWESGDKINWSHINIDRPLNGIYSEMISLSASQMRA